MINIVLGNDYPKEFDGIIIGVDVASYYLLENNYDIIAIGDFDSCNQEQYQYILSNAKTIIKYNSEKDETDLELAIRYCMENYPKEEITIYNPFKGNRIDHLLGNIALMVQYYKQGLDITMRDEFNIAYLLGPTTRIFKKDELYNKNYISFLALENVRNLSLNNFKYDLFNYNLKPFDTLCISNEYEEEGTLTFTSGLLLVMHSKD